ncbi:MAG: 5-oxoprolinase subunit PxpA [Halieaceae bacterium]|nr:5-oxoprolinase subunit PxpA [Halieaceae bacterium]
MFLNCDLGESFGAWTMGLDAEVMPFIDQANVATGFHAGDPMVIQHTLRLAKEHGVTIGAHPAYPDLVGFGRRSMVCSRDEIIAKIHYQVAAMDGMAAVAGLELRYVKPHGAMYNDMMAKEDVRRAILEALAEYHRPLALMMQATPEVTTHREEADLAGVEVWFEAFADRCYADDGKLLSRRLEGAVHTRDKMLAQVQQLCEKGSVTTISGVELPVAADTLCVHGDNAEGIAAIRDIRALVDKTNNKAAV